MDAEKPSRARVAQDLRAVAYDGCSRPLMELKRCLGLDQSRSYRYVFIGLSMYIDPGQCEWMEVRGVPRVYETVCGHVVDGGPFEKVSYCPVCARRVAILVRVDHDTTKEVDE